jgi:ribonuclease P protein subunit POP4
MIPPVKNEFIGCSVHIKECTDPTWIGKKGIIVDETQHLFLIEIKSTIKSIEKKIAIFQVTLPEKTIRINGSKIVYRPENRIKKAR